jgi:hypothetical protein
MPIRTYLQGRAFAAETTRAMGVAFEATRAALAIRHRADLTPEKVASIIIALVDAGELDPDRLCERAIATLSAPVSRVATAASPLDGSELLSSDLS